MAGRMTTRFVDDGGSTELIESMEISPSGVLRFVAPLMKGWLVRELKKDYERFEQVIAAES